MIATTTIISVITFYHCWSTKCINASGYNPVAEYSVACPSWIKLGTIVSIDGVGDMVCDDRTALRFNGRYDVFMGYGGKAYTKAKEFGKIKREVTIIN